MFVWSMWKDLDTAAGMFASWPGERILISNIACQDHLEGVEGLARVHWGGGAQGPSHEVDRNIIPGACNIMTWLSSWHSHSPSSADADILIWLYTLCHFWAQEALNPPSPSWRDAMFLCRGSNRVTTLGIVTHVMTSSEYNYLPCL